MTETVSSDPSRQPTEGATQASAAARVAVLLPCLNEETAIGGVVAAFRAALPEAHIVVCDNGSDDATADAAAAADATVITEPRRGKGRAVRRLLREVDADIYVMADGDGTYDPESASELVAALRVRDLDLLVAARRPVGTEAHTPVRRLGNRLFSALARWRCGEPVADLLSGYRVFTKRFADEFPLRSNGFGIETEMTVFASTSGAAWAEVDCDYFSRSAGSTSKLAPFRDGLRILRTLFTDHPLPVTRPRRNRGLLRAAALTAAVTLTATAAFLGLNWLTVRSDPEPVVDALRASFATPGNTIEDNTRERFNDCLLSLMTIDRGGSTLELTVSGRRVYRFTRPQRPCDALKQKLDQGEVDPTDYLTVFYHQYWAGQRVLLHWLLPPLGVDGLRAAFRWLTFGFLGLGLAGAAGRAAAALVRRRRLESWPLLDESLFQACSAAVLFLCLLLLFDLDDRAASFTTGPTNVLTFGLLLLLPLARFAAWKSSRQIVLCAAFGAVMAYFELLFGSVLLGFAALLLTTALAPATDLTHSSDGRMPRRRQTAIATVNATVRSLRRALIFRCIGAYAGAFAGVFLLRVLLAEIVFPQGVLAGFVRQLRFRLQGGSRAPLHPDIDSLYGMQPSLERFLDRATNHLATIGLGSTGLAVVLIAAAGTTLIVGTLHLASRWWRLADPWRRAAILAAGWSVPAWYAVFFAHTQSHMPVMIRLAGLSIAAAMILPLCRLTEGRLDGASKRGGR